MIVVLLLRGRGAEPGERLVTVMIDEVLVGNQRVVVQLKGCRAERDTASSLVVPTVGCW